MAEYTRSTQQENLFLIEKVLDIVLEMQEIVNGMKQNCKSMRESLGDDENATEVEENHNVFKNQVQESFLVWEDQTVEEGVEKGATDSTKEIQNSVLQMVNESTDEDELVEERKEKEVELEKIMAVPTVSVPKEIPLSSVIEDSFDKPIVLSQPSDFSIRISCLSSINTPLYINLTKTKHLITEMHPINHDSKRLLDRRCKDIFLRLVWHPPWETHALEWPPLTVGYFLNRKEPFGQAYSVQKMNFSIRIFSHLKPTFNRAFIAKVWEVEFVDYLAKEPYTEGAELIHFVLDMIHKETKDCDYLEGFQICPSLRGGTKFGVMIWIFMGYWYQIEQLKRLKKKGYDVLFMVDAIVEYAIGQLKEYDGREGKASKLFDEMLEGMLATYLNTYRVKRPFEFNGENDAAATARHVAGLEMYTITARLGGSGGRPEICVLSLLSLRCGVLVSADSTGSVHFWSNQQWTLLQAHSLHKGDVNALAAAPSHNRVLSTGSDGQVILYKLSSETVGPSDDKDSSIVMKEWTYVGYVRAHTHDVWTLTLVVPISREELFLDEKMKRSRSKEKPVEFIYHKWAHMGVQTVLKKKRTLVGLTTIVLTCKYKEVSVPFVEDLVLLSNEACTRKEVIDMERLMGKKFFASQKIDVVPLQIVFRPFDRGRGGVYSGIKRSTLMKINNVYICGPFPEVWFMFQLSTHDKAIFYEGYYEHKGDKKFKGTIAVGFTIDSKGELSWHQAELRQVIAIEVANDPTEYSEAILGKPNEEYCDWIVIQGSGEATLSFQD